MALAFALALLLSLPPRIPIASGAIGEPILRIAGVEHPASVRAGDPFEVKVAIEYSYSGWTIADLGIFAGGFTGIADCVRYYLTGSGSRQFSLRALAPFEAGVWNLTAVSRVWHGNYWREPEGARRDFSIRVVGPGPSAPSPLPAKPAKVRIGDSEWHYWGRPGGGACVIWLGGGHALPYHITVNPYELESFGTMRLIADLASLYGVLAPTLDQPWGGDVAPWSGPALRYSPGGPQLRAVREWASRAGHSAIFLAGYSTGGVAAAYEVASADPEGWAAPNGVIIISAPLGGISRGILASIPDSESVKANAILLYGRVYGGELWPQGLEFFQGIQEAGPQRKEWHLFEGSGHEVWFPEGDGVRYDRTPFRLIAGFIEACAGPPGAPPLPSANCAIALEPPDAGIRIEFAGDGFLSLWGEYIEGGPKGLGEDLLSRASGLGWRADAKTLALEVDLDRRRMVASFRAIDLARRDRAWGWSIDLGWLGDWAWPAIRIDGGFLLRGDPGGPGPFGCPGNHSISIALPSNAANATMDPIGRRLSFETPGPSLRAQIGAIKSPGQNGTYLVTLRIENDGPGIARYDRSDLEVVILDPAGREVYRWSRHRAAGWAGGEELPPGGSKSYSFEWSGRDGGGMPLPPGTYELRGGVGGLAQASAKVLIEGAIPGFPWPAAALGALLGLAALRLLRPKPGPVRRSPHPRGRR
ncbi:MAG: BsuPI-related putative proteinase inhibitor [Candidatus Bathyarchaeia archaeon]